MKKNLTAQPKNDIVNATKRKGRLSQPKAFRTLRNTTSTGGVMIKSVIIVSNGLGSGCFVDVEYEGRTDNAACRAVDKREMRIEPAAPGSPEEVTYRIKTSTLKQIMTHH